MIPFVPLGSGRALGGLVGQDVADAGGELPVARSQCRASDYVAGLLVES